MTGSFEIYFAFVVDNRLAGLHVKGKLSFGKIRSRRITASYPALMLWQIPPPPTTTRQEFGRFPLFPWPPKFLFGCWPPQPTWARQNRRPCRRGVMHKTCHLRAALGLDGNDKSAVSYGDNGLLQELLHRFCMYHSIEFISDFVALSLLLSPYVEKARERRGRLFSSSLIMASFILSSRYLLGKSAEK